LEVYINLHKRGKHVILAACDVELLGKILCEGKIVFEVREQFYKGSLVNVDEAIGLMKHCTIVNMIGKNIVQRAIDCGLVHPEAVLKISGVPHAQIVSL
jgi:hypothetical protein